MAKCSLCNSRKGKRKCLATGGFICSACCGDFRTANKCAGCVFFKDDRAQRNYANVPYYSTQQMADSFTLGNQSNSIESAICRFATDHYRDVKDENVVRLLQLLMDFYHFLDTEIIFQDELEEAGFAAIDQAIREDLGGFSFNEVARLLSTIYRSAKRWTNGGREYLEFIDKYVGYRVGPGIRAIPNFLDED